ncbi:MAG: nucleotidyltransferase domain-containing protein [Candidatus Cloacimonetes bacterium]|nr:nucleotidyltransferase domain-containing protein [Candidatus Cloacimonadota bacterium]
MQPLDLSNLHLPPQYLSILKILLKKHVPEATVWAYGSRVTGGCHEGSDLDLVLRHPSDLTRTVEGFENLQIALQESCIPVLIEVHLWSNWPQSFYQNIEAAYVVLQEREV